LRFVGGLFRERLLLAIEILGHLKDPAETGRFFGVALVAIRAEGRGGIGRLQG
jgi:hypothetical protein